MTEKHFWLHVEGTGVKGKKISLDVLNRYTKNFNKLYHKIVSFNHLDSPSVPLSEFKLFLVSIREGGSAKLGIRPVFEFTPILEHPSQKAIKKTVEFLKSVSEDKGYEYVCENYNTPDIRISLLEGVEKLGPYKRDNTLRITFDHSLPEAHSVELNLSIDEKVLERCEEWIHKEITSDVPPLLGHYIGFKNLKEETNLWIKLLTGDEITCKLEKNLHEDLINSLKINDRVEIFGKYKLIPGKKIKVEKVKKIRRIEPPALLKLEEMEKIIISFDSPDPELLDDLPKIREIIRRNHILLHQLGDD